VTAQLKAHAESQGTTVAGEAAVRTVEGGVVAGIYIRELNLEPRTAWARPEQERIASQKCVEAFFVDLRHIAASQEVVLLLDSYERRAPGLAEWIVNGFIRPLLLQPSDEPRAERLLVVLAGREEKLPPFPQMLSDRFDRLVSSRKLDGWEERDVREFLELHDLSVGEQDFEVVYRKVREGSSIRDALRLAEVLTVMAS
jgi:hypothetical protein